MHTRSCTRKRTLDKVEEELVVIRREVFEEEKKVEEEEKAEEPALVEMGDQAENPKALMDYSQPKINDIQSSIIRPAIRANTFEIKSSTIQIIQNSVQFGVLLLKTPTCISGISSRSTTLSSSMM